MKLAPVAAAFALSAIAMPAHAVTLDNGVVLITQADAISGNVTPGDTAGFPITLSVGGSYRLASNLAISTAVNGIEATAPEVTIDFAGFRMAGSGVGHAGITTNQRALTVKNGTIRGFITAAVHAGNAEGLVVDHMRLVDNPISGIDQGVINNGAGPYASITNSNLSRNGHATAVGCGNYCRVQNNIITGTGAFSSAVAVNGLGAIVTGNTIANYFTALLTNGSLSFGDNVITNNITSSQGTILPLDPNQPPPPP